MRLSKLQRKALPDLVTLAMVGFAILKADKSASEWSHPAIALFKDEVEPALEKRKKGETHDHHRR